MSRYFVFSFVALLGFCASAVAQNTKTAAKKPSTSSGNDIMVQEDTIFLVSKNRVSKLSMINGLLISEKVFDIKALGELKGFVGRHVYFKSDSTFKCLVTSDSTKQFLFTSTGKTLTTNNSFEVLNQTENSQLFILYLKTKFYKLLARGDETIVINHENKKIADLKISFNAVLIGSKLYKRKENSLLEIDMSELMIN